MKPVTFRCRRRIPRTPVLIRAAIADVARWSEFRGYGLIPGIQSAEYAERTSVMVGSVIRVRNVDGSTHHERILEWSDQRVVMELGDFTPPLSRFAERFRETWSFEPEPEGTRVTRRFELFPRGLVGWLLLSGLAFPLKAAIERQLEDMSRG